MPAGQYNFECEQGQTFRRTLLLTQREDPNDPDSPKVPIDLTGYQAAMQVRKDYLDPSVLVDFSTANNKITLGGPAGTITLELSASETQALTRSGVYDLEIISANGDQTRIIQGEFRLNLGVTR